MPRSLLADAPGSLCAARCSSVDEPALQRYAAHPRPQRGAREHRTDRLGGDEPRRSTPQSAAPSSSQLYLPPDAISQNTYLSPGTARSGLGHFIVIWPDRLEGMTDGADELLAGRDIQSLNGSSKPPGTRWRILPFVPLLARGQQLDGADIYGRADLVCCE